MKKLILLASILGLCLVNAQKKDQNNKDLKLKSDSTSQRSEKENNAQSRFYKNVDEQKASQYKMLSKKPDGEFLELPITKQHIFPAEIPSDSIQLNKKKK